MDEADQRRGSSSSFSPTECICLAIAKKKQMDVDALPLLRDGFDPEALDQLLQGPGSCHVTFTYAGYKVTILDNECIVIDELDNGYS